MPCEISLFWLLYSSDSCCVHVFTDSSAPLVRMHWFDWLTCHVRWLTTHAMEFFFFFFLFQGSAYTAALGKLQMLRQNIIILSILKACFNTLQVQTQMPCCPTPTSIIDLWYRDYNCMTRTELGSLTLQLSIIERNNNAWQHSEEVDLPDIYPVFEKCSVKRNGSLMLSTHPIWYIACMLPTLAKNVAVLFLSNILLIEVY